MHPDHQQPNPSARSPVVRSDRAPETRRHNAYGVDLTGGPANLDLAMLALNSHQELVTALRGLVAFIDDLDRTHCGLADFAERYPALVTAYPHAIGVLQGLGIAPFDER